jgi:PAS domain S-box-containing protein
LEKATGASIVSTKGRKGRRLTNEALGVSQADEIAAIYDTAPIGLCVLDIEGRYVRVNRKLAEINGVPVEAHIGRRVSDVIPDVAAKTTPIPDRIAAGVPRYGVEIRAETPARPGVTRTFRHSWAPLHNSSGALVGISVAVEEVAAERDAAAELLLSAQAMRAAEARSSRLRALLAAIGDTSPDMIYAKDKDGRFVYVNPAVARVIGHPVDELIGKSEEEWGRGTAEAQEIAAIDRRILSSGVAEIVEEPFTSPDGSRRIFRSAKTPMFDLDDQVVGLVGVSTDITAIRATERAAAMAAAEFKALAENVSQLVWMAQPDGHIFWYNRRWFEFTGTTLEEMQGWGWQRVHHPDHIERVTADWKASIARGQRYEGTFPLRRSDGVYRWFLTRVEPIRDAEGQITRWFGTNTDITEQIETAEALAQSEARFRTMAEALPGMLFVASGSDGNLDVNRGYASFTGRPKTELLGHKWVEVLHPDDQARAREIWGGAVRAETIYMAEYRFRRHDGAWRWHIVRGLPVRDAQGRVVSWVGACIDIHERKVAEEELHQLVEEAVAKREEALFQLHEAQKLETIGQLTGGIAHDFNNLLTPIVGSLDLLRRRIEDDRSVRLVDGALASAERARTLIQRLLAFARRQTLQPRAVDPAQLVSGMQELIERSLGPRILFRAEVEPGLPPALIDANQLELALLNLSVNARDAMPQGGELRWRIGRETVAEARADLAAGDYIRFTISDTGEGMSRETLARAIEPFFSTKAAGKGTGLGLSMVHGLAAQSGGAFRLESEEGRGTTASLWLPVATDEVALPIRAAEARSASRRANVLLVDDEEQVRFTTSESLVELGYDVFACASAEEALQRVQEGLSPDLLVTDHLMPGMTGAQLALELRKKLPRLPVLMITGYAQLRPEEAGDFDVLVKPYRHAELALRIAELLAEEPVLQRALS